MSIIWSFHSPRTPEYFSDFEQGDLKVFLKVHLARNRCSPLPFLFAVHGSVKLDNHGGRPPTLPSSPRTHLVEVEDAVGVLLLEARGVVRRVVPGEGAPRQKPLTCALPAPVTW